MTSDDRKRELKAQFRDAAEKRLIASLPLDIQTLKDLLSYLNREAAPACDHSLRETIAFLQGRKIDPAPVIPWLQEQGGYCDCEVIGNVYDAVGDLVGWHLDEES